MANTINFSNTTPAAPGGQTNVTFQVDASTTPNLSAYVPAQVNADWSAVSGTAQILNKPTLGTAAAQPTSAFDAAGAAATAQAASLQIANNLSDLNNAATARTNLGLGTAATQASSAFDAAGAASAAVAAIPVFVASGASHAKGLVPDPGVSAGSTKFLREDSTWATPAGGAVTTVFGRTGDVVALATDYPAFVASGGSHAQGMVPDPGASAGTTKYLREDGTWAVAVQNSGAYTWSSVQTFSQSITFNLALIAKMISTNCRTVVAATDTATVNTDHTLILNGVTTETLPASPQNGHKFYLVNIGGSAATVSGNGHNIWVAGVSAATLSLAPNASIILQYDTTNTVWRQISAPLTASATQPGILSSADWSTFNGKQAALGYTPLNPANNLSEVTAATARTNLGVGFAWLTYGAAAPVGSGSMTFSAVSYPLYKYYIIGNFCYVTIRVEYTVGGTPSNTLFVPIPQTPAFNYPSFACVLSDNGGSYVSATAIINGTSIQVSKSGGAVYTAGAGALMISGFYGI